MEAFTVVAPHAAARARVSRAWQLPFKTWQPLMVNGISRLIAAPFIVTATYRAHRPGSADLATAWDGGWYRTIATQGYPSRFAPRHRPTGRTEGMGILARIPDAGACAPGGGPARLLGGRAKPEPRPGCRCNGCGLGPDGARRQPLLRLLLTCTFLAAPVMQLVYSKSLTGIKARMAGRVKANTRRTASELSCALMQRRGDLSCLLFFRIPRISATREGSGA